ncbi:hypothetical protein ABEB36_000024 [Hypothenemus hampei]|uniref:CCHC-type domain-containing protein n=1 Tax=Hypothenemus hampei TaxID=57062 RepID=A0ABD1FA12_HYPHA
MENLDKSLGAIAAILEKLQQRSQEECGNSNDRDNVTSPITPKTPLNLTLPNFDPELTDSTVWITKIEGFKEEFKWSDRETVSRIGPFLTKSAEIWFRAWRPEEESWKTFKTDFLQSFPKQRNLGKLLADAVSYSSSDAQSYVDYARLKLEKLKSVRANWSELDLIDIIIHSIQDHAVRTAAFNCNVKTVSELIAYLVNFVKNPQTTEKPFLKQDRLELKRKRPHQTNSPNSTSQVCFICRRTGHIARDCRQNSNNKSEKSNKGLICRYCKKPGHEISNCFAKINKENRIQNGVSDSENNSNPKKRVMINSSHKGTPRNVSHHKFYALIISQVINILKY